MSKVSVDEKILSIAFADKKLAMDLVNSVNEKYFTSDWRWLYEALSKYFQDPVIKSIPSANMIKEFATENNIQNYEGRFKHIVEMQVDHNEFKWLVNKIQLRYNHKIHKDVNKKISGAFGIKNATKQVEEINKIIKGATVEIDSVGQKKMYKEGQLRDSANSRVERYKFIKEHPEAARGILTGLSTFDRITNGLHPGEFMIVAGSTGTGKSILMHNIAVNAYMAKNSIYDISGAQGGNNVLYFSLEMPKEVMERRIDACIAEVYSNHIRDGLLSEDDEQKYFKCLGFQESYNKSFHIVDMPKGATTRDIELKFIEISENYFKPDLVVVDYMGIMSSNDSSGSDWMDLGIISAELHEFARIYEVPVITGSQVNRPKDGVESYSNNRIARSGMIPNNANVIIQIGCREDEDLRTDMPIYITKMRDGEKGMFTLSKNFGKMKVIDIVETGFTDEEDDDIV